MSELSINKKMRVINLYLQGYSYDDIVKKTGVAKGSVFNTISDLKEGLFPEISTIPEEIEQLRELATDIKRNGISLVKASIGLSILERLTAMEVEPKDIEKCHTLMQALSSPDKDLPAMAKSILAIEEIKQKTGLTLEELEAKVVALRQEAERLSPISEQAKAKRKELTKLEENCNSLMSRIKELTGQETTLSDYVNKLEVKEVRLRNHAVELEERAHAADKQLIDARKNLKILDKIGMNVEDLGRFTIKLKEVSAHHDVKPPELSNRLLKDLKSLDNGLNLEYAVKEKQAQLTEVTDKIARGQTEKDNLHAYLKQLMLEKGELEARLSHYRKQIDYDISALSHASEKAIQDINKSLKDGIGSGLLEVSKLADEAVKLGKEVGEMEARIESLNWIKPMLSMVRGENGLKDYQVRVIGLTILRGVSLWLNENYGQDFNLYSLKRYINDTISEFEKWNSTKN